MAIMVPAEFPTTAVASVKRVVIGGAPRPDGMVGELVGSLRDMGPQSLQQVLTLASPDATHSFPGKSSDERYI